MEVIERSQSGELSLVEEELNRWSAAVFESTEEIEKGFLNLEAEPPNFRIASDTLTVRIPLTWSAFGQSRTFDAQTSGTIVPEGDSHTFDYGRVYIGSCPLPGPLAARLFRDVSGAYEIPDALRDGWAALETVAIEGDSLLVEIP